MTFAEKNQARKTHFRSTEGQDRRLAVEARAIRRILDGAFGGSRLTDFPTMSYDKLAWGTSGTTSQ